MPGRKLTYCSQAVPAGGGRLDRLEREKILTGVQAIKATLGVYMMKENPVALCVAIEWKGLDALNDEDKQIIRWRLGDVNQREIGKRLVLTDVQMCRRMKRIKAELMRVS